MDLISYRRSYKITRFKIPSLNSGSDGILFI